MNSFIHIDGLLYSTIGIIGLLVHIKIHADEYDLKSRVFSWILWALILNMIIEMLSVSFNGIDTDIAYIINYWTSGIAIMITPLPIVLWFIYYDYKAFADIDKLKKRALLYFIPFLVSSILFLLNFNTGILYTIESGNFYKRSFGVIIVASIIYIFILVIYFYIRKHKKYYGYDVLNLVIIIMFLPLISTVIQLTTHGISILWPSMSVATLLSFIAVEKDTFYKDSLTKVGTRNQLQIKIRKQAKNKSSFSLIMIDLDDFKEINDKYGHIAGDEALISVASILSSSVKRFDLVSRYGGDEFFIFIDSLHPSAGEKVKERIERKVEYFNQKKVHPFEIKMSIGVKYFGNIKGLEVHSIISSVDEIMYLEKDMRKKRNANQ